MTAENIKKGRSIRPAAVLLVCSLMWAAGSGAEPAREIEESGEIKELRARIDALEEDSTAARAMNKTREEEIAGLRDSLAAEKTEKEKITEALALRDVKIKDLLAEKSELKSLLKKAERAIDRYAGSRYREKALVRKDRLAREKREMDKERLIIHYNLAGVYYENGSYEQAEKEYLQCLKIDPDDPETHYNLAILYDDKLHENKKAIRHYKEFLKLRPMGDDAVQARAWIFRAEQEIRLGAEVR